MGRAGKLVSVLLVELTLAAACSGAEDTPHPAAGGAAGSAVDAGGEQGGAAGSGGLDAGGSGGASGGGGAPGGGGPAGGAPGDGSPTDGEEDVPGDGAAGNDAPVDAPPVDCAHCGNEFVSGFGGVPPADEASFCPGSLPRWVTLWECICNGGCKDDCPGACASKMMSDGGNACFNCVIAGGCSAEYGACSGDFDPGSCACEAECQAECGDNACQGFDSTDACNQCRIDKCQPEGGLDGGLDGGDFGPYQCMCVTTCAADCGDNFCMGAEPSAQCAACGATNCYDGGPPPGDGGLPLDGALD